ncbi:hypothetical protein LOAG_07340 [Loa loa]|uniref:Uncharacterized protein n=1 Tax=Loa loa TaxID=7209 RepID=A0A1S0TXH9_LOALO|nr:hypothetical protein LOAG_07340 [Loa loa]EFO21151.2 hypothetical protein LOAG_07340 [Loa loa]
MYVRFTKIATKTTTVTLEEQQQQPRQLISSSNDTAVAGGCLDATTTSIVTSSSITPIDPQPFFHLSLSPKDKFKLAVGNSGDGFSKRQSRRTVTVLDGSCRVNSAENDRYQLSRQDASVSHARRSPLGRLLILFQIFNLPVAVIIAVRLF